MVCDPKEKDGVINDAENNSDEDLGACDMDIHIEASQNRNRFECPDCSYSCSYIEIFNTHRETHTGEIA